MNVLPVQEYHRIIPLLDQVPFNCIFARSIAQRHLDGTIFVDDARDVHNAYIVHPYGMSFLVGDRSNKEFEAWLFSYLLDEKKQRFYDEWMQVYPDYWNDLFHSSLSSDLIRAEENKLTRYTHFIEINQRVNFLFHEKKYPAKKSIHLPDADVIRLDERSYDMIKGTVVPSAFWNNASEFVENGVGFGALADDQIVSVVFSAFRQDNLLEIGIETMEPYRGRGYGTLTSMAYIDYCLKHGFIPVWSCRYENTNSYDLARKLGFEPTFRLPFYRLCRQ